MSHIIINQVLVVVSVLQQTGGIVPIILVIMTPLGWRGSRSRFFFHNHGVESFIASIPLEQAETAGQDDHYDLQSQ